MSAIQPTPLSSLDKPCSNSRMPSPRRRISLPRSSYAEEDMVVSLVEVGRGDMIRTWDPLLPKEMRYQAALRPDWTANSTMGPATGPIRRRRAGVSPEAATRAAGGCGDNMYRSARGHGPGQC